MRTLIALLLTATAAHSEPCAGLDVIAGALTHQYAEAPQHRGYSQDGRLMTVWVNPDTGSWTITLTDTTGKTCIISDGSNYQTKPEGDPA